MSLNLRSASTDDAEDIARLTNHFILHTTVHFGSEPWTAAAVRKELTSAAQTGHPWYVARSSEGAFAGYAKSGPWRARHAYRFTAESACYVEPDRHRRGVGRRLYERLMAGLVQGGFHTAVAGVTLPNVPSEALHLACGFRRVGTFGEVGFKQGRWCDVAWFERRLDDGPPGKPGDLGIGAFPHGLGPSSR